MNNGKKEIHRANTRGYANHGWLESWHTFSFADYFNRHRMHFGALRVINDDIVKPQKGFDMHPHRDMEIISVPLAGALWHRDNLGNEAVIRHGEVQVMSAGTGILHSEFNGSSTEETNLLQIWVLTAKPDATPRYDQKFFPQETRNGRFQLIVSPDGRDHSLMIHQTAFFSLTTLPKGAELSYSPYAEKTSTYFFLIEGKAQIAEENLERRDGMGVNESTTPILIHAKENCEILVMEVSMHK